MVKTKQTEIEKRRYAVMGQQYIKGKRIKLTPNEKSLLGLIVYRSQSEGSIHLANTTICDVFGWGPEQLNRTCKGLMAKGIITKDTSEAVHGQQGSEYTLLERSEVTQQPAQAIEQQLPFESAAPQTPAEPQNDKEAITLLKRQLDNQATTITLLKQQNQRLGKSLWALRERVEVIEQDLNRKMELLANVFNPRSMSSTSKS